MTITREQVADLRPGDIVRINGWYGLTVEGPVSNGTASLWLGQHLLLRDSDGSVGHGLKRDATLTVLSRAPRPLYVNHDRTEPVKGDVVRNAEAPGDLRVWMFDGYPDEDAPWNLPGAQLCCRRDELPRSLRLLVDGETGQVVP